MLNLTRKHLRMDTTTILVRDLRKANCRSQEGILNRSTLYFNLFQQYWNWSNLWLSVRTLDQSASLQEGQKLIITHNLVTYPAGEKLETIGLPTYKRLMSQYSELISAKRSWTSKANILGILAFLAWDIILSQSKKFMQCTL